MTAARVATFDQEASDLRVVSRTAFTAFSLLVLFFLMTKVSNRVEAVDTLTFSADAEVASFWSNPDSRMLLFYRINRAAVQAAESLGLQLDVYIVLGALGAIFAAGSVLLLYRLLRTELDLSGPTSVFGALTLAFSYGFLRYATEVEVYIGATFLTLLCLNLLFHYLDRPPLRVSQAILLGAASGVAVTYYQPTAFPLFFAATLLFLHKRYFLQFLAYGATGVGVYLLSVVLALWGELGRFPEMTELSGLLVARSDEFFPPEIGVLSFAKAGLAILHDFLSLMPFYALPGAEELIKRLVPQHHYFAEDFFFATRNYGAIWIAVATFVAALVWFAYLVVRAIFAKERRPLDIKVAFVFLWFAIVVAANIKLNPAEREVWITSLPAIAILVAVFIYEPLKTRPRALAVMVALVLSHNLIGGIAIYRNPDGDLYASRTSWIREHGERGDWLIRTGFPGDRWNKMKILRYPIAHKPEPDISDQFFNFMFFGGDRANREKWGYSPDELISPDEMLRLLKTTGNRVFAPEAVIDPKPLPPRADRDEVYARLVAFGAFLKGYAKVVDDGPLGKTYEIDKARLPDTLPKP
ncbi:hypothetical protein [Hyphomicrobium sp. CS1GBMeth3]|uniref:hypothetical protein n=1 Tax=Hyphomicrobium sp. CS1GBMeth3 TaxID=1892845 RepID=UPI000930BDEF|nr:hypothetical protein [Hyphomicrobium sp. CS1GBMeth3]